MYQPTKREKLFDFTLKIFVFALVNYSVLATHWAHHYFIPLAISVGTAVVASFLLTYYIHPWRRRKLAERRAARMNR